MAEFIFVGGAPRSGTSLLQRILNSNSKIYGGPEFNRLIRIIELRNSFKKGIDNGQLNAYFSKVSEIDDIINIFVSQIFEDTLVKNKKTVLSEKTPNNLLVFEELIEVFPKAKFLFIVRSPFAIINSMKNVRNKALEFKQPIPDIVSSIKKSIKSVNKFWEVGFKILKKYPNRIHFIKYEDLMSNPLREIKSISDFLDVEFEENMLTPNNQKFDFKIKSDTIWASNKVRKKEISDESIAKWKKELSAFEKYYIMKKGFNNVLLDSYYEEMNKASIFIKIRYFFVKIFDGTVDKAKLIVLNKIRNFSLKKLA